MIYNFSDEAHFQVMSSSFSVSPTVSGYTLMFSANGLDYSPFTTVAPGQNKQFVNMSNGNYYYLSGNTGDFEVNWERECHGGGGGGTAGVSSIDGETGALTTKTINGNAILGSGDIQISGSDFSLEFNKAKEVEHTGYTQYVFTHSGDTWGSWSAYVADVTNGSHTFRLSINQQSGFRGEIYMYDTSVSDWHSNLNAVMSRPMVKDQRFYLYFSDFYAKYEVDPNDANATTWTFAIPSGYSIDLKELSPDYTGIEYAGSAETSFTEIGPASPVLLYDDFTGNTYCPLFYQYILTHRLDEDFLICGRKYMIQNSTSGDDGIAATTSVDVGGDGRDLYLTFVLRGGQYLFGWNNNSFFKFGKQETYTLPTASANTLGGIKVGNGLQIDSNGVLSAKVSALSQAEYDALVQAGTVDPTMLYVII